MNRRYALTRYRPTPGDDRGSLAFAILAIVLSAALGGLMVPILVSQSHTTISATTRVHALHAAQSGIDVVLGEIRAATTTASSDATGDPTALPCGPLTGNANGTATASYSATIAYYAVNPATTNALPMSCTSGYGPYDLSLNTRTPRFAVINSTGTDGPAVHGATKGRTLQTTYVFQTNDSILPGGQIKIFPFGTASYCMDAQYSSPAAGTPVLLRACSTTNPPAAQQNFVYRQDLTIQLVSSVTTANLNGMCIDTNPATHTSGIPMVMMRCANADPTVPANTPSNQQWSVDDNAHLRGALTTKSNTDSYCINVATQSDGQSLTLAGCAGGTTDTAQTWVPGVTAGAGMAGSTNNQIVNYKNFATCIDVTGQDPTTTFLILYTCKQNPNPGNVAWNQKFAPALGPLSKIALPTTGTLTTNNGTSYCLQSPTSGSYVTVATSCTPGANNIWTWYQTKDSAGTDLPYARVFTIVDSTGRCLSPGPSTDQLNGQYLKIIVAPCDGDTDQKWNADPSVLASRMINTTER